MYAREVISIAPCYFQNFDKHIYVEIRHKLWYLNWDLVKKSSLMLFSLQYHALLFPIDLQTGLVLIHKINPKSG